MSNYSKIQCRAQTAFLRHFLVLPDLLVAFYTSVSKVIVSALYHDSCSGNRVIQGLGSVPNENGKLPVLFLYVM